MTRWADAFGGTFVDDEVSITERADRSHVLKVRNREYVVPPESDYYVAMFDILGFKDTVGKMSMLDSLHLVESQIQSTLDMACWRWDNGDDFSDRPYPVPFAETMRYADTVLLYRPVGSDADLASWLCASSILLCLLLKQGLPARGALVRGPLFVDRDNATVLGNALFKAHDLETSQQWAGAVVDEATVFASPATKDTVDRAFASGLLTRTKIPTKDEAWPEMPCLDWPYATSGTLENLRRGVFGAGPFSDEVETKIQHSLDFYAERKQACPRPNEGNAFSVNPAYYPPYG